MPAHVRSLAAPDEAKQVRPARQALRINWAENVTKICFNCFNSNQKYDVIVYTPTPVPQDELAVVCLFRVREAKVLNHKGKCALQLMSWVFAINKAGYRNQTQTPLATGRLSTVTDQSECWELMNMQSSL